MGKPMKLGIKGKIFPKELKTGLNMFLERLNPADVLCKPPANLNEFEDRLGELLMSLGNLFFGLTYDVETGKTLKREKTLEALVKALCNHEKYCQNNHAIFVGLSDHYEFLKLVLENDAPLSNDIYILGVRRDRSGLSSPQKNTIAVQAAVQVLWHTKKSEIPTLEKMREELILNTAWNNLLKREDPQLPELKIMNPRTIENWIRKVCPIPKDMRRGRPSNEKASEGFFKTLITIPEIFLDDGRVINFSKLKFTIICLTRVLKALGWTQDRILKSDFVHLYQKDLRFYPRSYVRDWVHETFEENGSIFAS